MYVHLLFVTKGRMAKVLGVLSLILVVDQLVGRVEGL